VAHALSTYVTLGIPAILGTLYAVGKALDLYERFDALRFRTEKALPVRRRG